MSPDRNSNAEPKWNPKADVFVNTDGDYVVKVEVPGVKKEDLELTVQEQNLTITCFRPDPDAGQSHYLVRELGSGFQLILDFPWGFDPQRGQAAYQNGILRITVPPQEIKR